MCSLSLSLSRARACGADAAFLSHFKEETAAHARIIKDGLEQRFERSREEAGETCKVFLDSDNLRSLSELRHCVAASDVIVVLLSPGVLTRPWCLVELITAMERGKPLVGVLCAGLGKKAYDFEATCEYLSNLGPNLEALNPGAIAILRQAGVTDLNVVGKALVHYLHNPIAVPFQVNWSAGLMAASIDDVAQAIAAAKPPPDASQKLRATIIFTKWAGMWRKRNDARKAESQAAAAKVATPGKRAAEVPLWAQ